MKLKEMMNLKRGDNVYCHHDGKKVKMIFLGLKYIDDIEMRTEEEKPLDEPMDEINIKDKPIEVKAVCIYADDYADKNKLEKYPWLLEGLHFSYRQIHKK